MRQEKEDTIRKAFIAWAARQTPPPGIMLPEVSTAGKRIDLVCIEGPLDTSKLTARLKVYLFKVWLRANNHFSRPDWVRRFGIDQTHMRSVAKLLTGKRVWVVELKEHLTNS